MTAEGLSADRMNGAPELSIAQVAWGAMKTSIPGGTDPSTATGVHRTRLLPDPRDAVSASSPSERRKALSPVHGQQPRGLANPRPGGRVADGGR